MLTIWKYEIPVTDEFELELSVSSEFLTIQLQHDCVCLWVKHDTLDNKKTYKFHCYGTGHPIETESNLEYIDSIQLHDGNLVFHYFVEV